MRMRTNGSSVSILSLIHICKRNLERTAMIAAAADASVKTLLRYDLNIAQGIIHTQKEYAVTDIVIGLHRKTNLRCV